jgi:hypothetical protein
MYYGMIIPSIETQDTNELASSNEVLLSETERDSLRLFVVGLGNRIEEDTSLFTSTERKYCTAGLSGAL